MKPLPEIRVLEGPAAGRSIPLTEAGQTYTVGGPGCDLALPGLSGRLVLRVDSIEPAEVTLVAVVGLDVSISGGSARLPWRLCDGEVLRLAGTDTALGYLAPIAELAAEAAEERTVMLDAATALGAMKKPQPDEPQDEATTLLNRDDVDEALAAAPSVTTEGTSAPAPVVTPSPAERVQAGPEAAEEIRAVSASLASDERWAPTREISTSATDATVVAGAPFVLPPIPPVAPAPSAAPSTPEAEDRTVMLEPMQPSAPAPADEDHTVLLEAPAPAPEATAEMAPPPGFDERTVLGAPSAAPVPPEDRTVLGAAPTPPPASATMAPPPAPPRGTPAAHASAAAPAKSGGGFKTALIAVSLLFFLVAAAGVVVLVVWAPWKRGTPPSSPAAPPTIAASPAPATTGPTAAPATPTATASHSPAASLRIVRLEPPAAAPGAKVTLETEGAPPDVGVFFGPAAATIVSRNGDVIEVEVPNIGAAASAPVTLRAGSEMSAPKDFTVDTPALPQVAFRYEMRPDAKPPVATIYLGPVPLFVIASKGSATSTEERARLAALDLDAARTLLAGNSAAGLRIQQGRRTWDVVVAEPSGPPLATVCSVGSEEAAFVTAQGQPATPDRLAGYWMSILNDAMAMGFGVGRLDRLPPDSPGGTILRKMTAGGLQKGFASLSPEDRAELEALPLRIPDALGGFAGTFRGITKLDRDAFPEIRWPRVELEIEIAFSQGTGMQVPGEMSIKWISTLDDSGLNKTYNKLGTFPVAGALDPANLNRLVFTIQHAGVTVPFVATRKIESGTGAISIEGRYNGTTDFLLKKL